MFHMMNEERIGVGMGAVLQGSVGYLHSLQYARERKQGRPDQKDPSSPPVALIEHADVRRMLLQQKCWVEGALALGFHCSMLVDMSTRATETLRRESATAARHPHADRQGLGSECSAEGQRPGHPGAGRLRIHARVPVEQCYRDNRINPIHEGTNGIQAIDLLGRKAMMQNGAALKLLTERINQTIDNALQSDTTAAYADGLRRAVQRLVDVTATLWAAGDVATTLANSSIYLEAAGHVIMAWMWLEQLIAASDHQGDFYDGKRAAARYFYTYELPKVDPQFDLLASLDRTTVDAQASWF